jgi:ribonuclease P protein component
VLRTGASLRSRHFVLKHRSNAGLGARLGLIVARRLLKRAVDRNLVKRVAREAFRSAHQQLPSEDLVLRLAGSITDFDRRALRNELDGLLARLA